MKVGRVNSRLLLSPSLASFRLQPEPAGRFPEYEPGQYIALRREVCQLTRLVVGARGERRFVPDLDVSGAPRLGPVTHPYSIASAPSAARDDGSLEFYVILERDAWGTLGRLSHSLFELELGRDDALLYADRAAGSFTLEKRAAGFSSVLLAASGTGLAPFVSMIRELHLRARRAPALGVRYTLIHANRTRPELGFHDELLDIEAAGRFDFVYIGSVSRPTVDDTADPRLGRGRANNVLRHLLDMPLCEEESVQIALGRGEDSTDAKLALARTVLPTLPAHLSRAAVQQRLDPSRTVILTCGNPAVMADIERIASRYRMRFEKEKW